MRTHRLIAFSALSIAALALAVESAVAAAWTWLSPPLTQSPALVIGNGAAVVFTPSPLNPALINSLRHESGMKRLASARGG